MSENVCEKCGQVHPGCTAHTKTTGNPCLHTRIHPGATVCFRHGGNSPQALRAAQERENRRIVTELYEADPQAAIAAYGAEAIIDPLDLLSKLLASAVHHMDAMGQRVNALDEIRYESKAGGEQIRAEVKLFTQAMDRAAKLADMVIRSGFEDRRLKLDEQTAQLFVTAMQRVLARLNLTPEQTLLVGTVVPETLRELNS